MAAVSAGILLYRAATTGLEVFLVHPGGPFWAKKDDAAWSIPKGVAEANEDHAAAASREFAEEVGPLPSGELQPLGAFKQSGGKTVVAFALEGDFDPAKLKSNLIEIDWPPRSGRKLTIPEVDRAAWVDMDQAVRKLHVGQRPILDALRRHVNAASRK